MKEFRWQKYVYSACLLAGIIVGIITQETVTSIAAAALAGLVLHFAAGYFFPAKDE